MTRLRVLLGRLQELVSAPKRDATLAQEIQAHLDLLTQDYRRAGLSERQARAAARRAFGGVDQMKEAYPTRFANNEHPTSRAGYQN